LLEQVEEVIGDWLVFEVVVHDPQLLADEILDDAAHRSTTIAVSSWPIVVGGGHLASPVVISASVERRNHEFSIKRQDAVDH
jgi:hypothetical protein